MYDFNINAFQTATALRRFIYVYIPHANNVGFKPLLLSLVTYDLTGPTFATFDSHL